jgi:hypothetical protein
MQFPKITIVAFSALVTSVFAGASMNFYSSAKCAGLTSSADEIGDRRCRAYDIRRGIIVTSVDTICSGKLAVR